MDGVMGDKNVTELAEDARCRSEREEEEETR